VPPTRPTVRSQQHQRVEVGDRVVEPVDQRARTVGAAVTAVLDRVHRKALGDKLRGHVRIAVAVLGGPMRDHDHRAHIPLRTGDPLLPADAQPAGADE
jgi:hypothetical protein